MPESSPEASGEKLYTLTEASTKTGISMPTLQRYKKKHQDRLPAVGKGRTQRYPEEALEVFEQIKEENLSRRGRPKKSSAKKKASKAGSRKGRGKRVAGSRRKRGKSAKKSEGLLTLTEIAKRTGISYPTLQRYVKKHLSRIPHEGKGRKRRYPPEAVKVFSQIREESRRGRKKKTTTKKKATTKKKTTTQKKTTRKRRTTAQAAGSDGGTVEALKDLKEAQDRTNRQLQEILETLKRPVSLTLGR